MFKKYKKATTFNPLIILILSVMGVIVIILFLISLKNNIAKNSEESICAASIQSHIFTTKKMLFTEEQIDKTLLTQLAPFTANIPEIKCNTELIESNIDNSAEAEELILKEFVKTWEIFDKGNSPLFPHLDKDLGLDNINFCFVKSVIDFKDKSLNINITNASQRTYLKQLFPHSQEDMTVLEYFYFNDEFQTLSFDDDNGFNTWHIVMNYPSSSGFHSSKFKLDNWGVFKTIFKDELDITIDDFKTVVAELPPSSFNLHPLPLDIPIAIVFQQFHMYSSHLFVSAVYAVPYTSRYLKLNKCEYMPIEFED